LEDIPAAITTAVLTDAIENQLQLPTAVTLTVRLQEIRFWAALQPQNSASALGKAVLLVRDPIQASTGPGYAPTNAAPGGILEEITDYPDQVRRAACGFRYSFAQSNVAIPLSGLAQNNEICRVIGGGPGSVMYINLLWRTATTLATLDREYFGMDYESDVEVISNSTAKAEVPNKPIRRRGIF
jgi:hypothetical protein